MNNQHIYQLVNERILDALVRGVPPWRKPWSLKRPVNAVSGKPYRGINPFLLPTSLYFDHRWLSFRQANELGGSVRQGERGSLIVFWTRTHRTEQVPNTPIENRRDVPILRYYNVFNVEQCDGLKIDDVTVAKTMGTIPTPESIVANMRDPPSEKRSERALYFPAHDVIYMPQRSAFDSREAYASTLFHEYVHSTGHPNRLARFDLTQPLAPFGSEDYSREELIAEFGAAFLCATAGIDNTQESSAAYINGWSTSIKNDPAMMVVAAGKAQKAADHILGIIPISDEDPEQAPNP